MSEEEKEAINNVEKFVYSILNGIGANDCKILLNYISKLQKENEKLKEDNSKLILGKFREVADKNSYIKEMYISKDKIKDKIKEIEDKIHIVIPNEYNKMEVINEFKNEGAINVLQELLEE